MDLYAYLFDVGDDAYDAEILVLIAPDCNTDPEGFMRSVVECPYLPPLRYNLTAWRSRVKVGDAKWAHVDGKSSDDS